MSGYLARIVERHTVPARGGIMPKTPGWFEPVHPALEQAPVWPEDEAAPAVAPAAGPAARTDRAGATASWAEARAEAREASAPAIPQPVAALPGGHARPVASPAPADPVAHRVVDSARPEPEVPEPPAAGAVEAALPVVRGLPRGRTRVPVAPVSHSPPAVPIARGPLDREVVIPAAARAAGEYVPSDDLARPETPVARPVWERLVSLPAASLPVSFRIERPWPPNRPPDEERAPRPGHTVEVSIGRIEVRATPAAEGGGARRRPAPATMTLEEYLRRRTQGAAR